MPLTVNKLFQEYDIENIHKVSWGVTVNSREEGIYVVSLSSDPSQNLGVTSKPSINKNKLEEWFLNVPNFTIEGKRDLELLEKRLTEF